MDAGKRFRHCVKHALSRVGSSNGFSSVALPNLGGGIFGYEPRGSSRTLLEESFETLLQIESQAPSYTLKQITFVENRFETAELLNNALTELSHRWLPERRLTTAPQYWGRATRRLILLPLLLRSPYRRHKLKFKRHHGVKRKARRDYLGNIRPFLWRAHRVHQPPPLLVTKDAGEIAPSEVQHKARPYYFRGVTHWLFPSRRSGFHALRKSGRGHWVGQPRQYRLREDVRPRL